MRSGFMRIAAHRFACNVKRWGEIMGKNALQENGML
jgi:hypothetical protein